MQIFRLGMDEITHVWEKKCVFFCFIFWKLLVTCLHQNATQHFFTKVKKMLPVIFKFGFLYFLCIKLTIKEVERMLNLPPPNITKEYMIGVKPA